LNVELGFQFSVAIDALDGMTTPINTAFWLRQNEIAVAEKTRQAFEAKMMEYSAEALPRSLAI
jgi:hypothetical protein